MLDSSRILSQCSNIEDIRKIAAKAFVRDPIETCETVYIIFSA